MACIAYTYRTAWADPGSKCPEATFYTPTLDTAQLSLLPAVKPAFQARLQRLWQGDSNTVWSTLVQVKVLTFR